ncbi:MAG: hypothetical protein Q9168_007841 [Polycauliona sp. 1 TL-2023]
MSFINSVLSTIGGEHKQSQYASPTPPRPQPVVRTQPTVRKIETKVESKPAVTAVQSMSTGQKRKAEEPLPALKAKILKEDHGQKKSTEATVAARVSPTKQAARPTVSTSKSALAVPYRGTSRPSPSSPSPASASPTTAPARSAPPKKGSYAEIMARAATNNQSQSGVIKHKPKDTISVKQEIKMRKKGILPNGKAGVKDVRKGKVGRNSNSPVGSSTKSKNSSKKPLPQPSYKGTAAPKPQPTYRGTMNMKPGSSISNTARRKDSKSDRSRSSSINPSRRGGQYESEEEEEDEDDVDEEENGYSDESDDMEAGAFEVEQEEIAARKAARKEDEEELRIENQLKKEKEDRKKRLAMLAAKAAKPRY